MEKLLLIAILGVLAPTSGEKTGARRASCPGSEARPACLDFWQTPVVFIGTVTHVITEPFPAGQAPDYQEYRKLTATLKVEESFRGDLTTQAIFEMSDCYFEFKEGEKYLVYAYRDNDGKLIQRRRYGRTRLVSEAQEDLLYIRSLATAPDGGRIFGKVFDHRVTPTLDRAHPAATPMIGLRVTASAGDQSYYAITNGTGDYEITGLPPGTYTVRADVAGQTSYSTQEVKVLEKACAPTSFHIQASGEVSGRVVDSQGKGLSQLVVTIFAAQGVTDELLNRVRPYYSTRSETDKDGAFSFPRLPAGQYFLAVNLLEKEQAAGSRASEFPKMFYPGVTSLADAEAISLGDGKELKGLKIKLAAATTPKPASATPLPKR